MNSLHLYASINILTAISCLNISSRQIDSESVGIEAVRCGFELDQKLVDPLSRSW